MTDEPKLLPCPFCGGEAELCGDKMREYFVRCKTCEASAMRDMELISSAIVYWNARVGQLEWTKEPPT